MKKFGALALPLLLFVLVVGIAACGKTPGGTTTSTLPNQVKMDSLNFLTTSITIKAGESVNFVDPSDTGAVHIICSGQNGTCDKSTSAPKDLQGDGFEMDPGDTKAVEFDTAGTYKITCSIHPDMNLTVTVQ